MATKARAEEKAVLAAALESAAAYEAYSQAFDRNHDGAGYNDKYERVVPMHPETVALLAVYHAKHDALDKAANALLAATRPPAGEKAAQP